MGYPPPPWHLVGRMSVSMWAPPADAVPALPAALRPAIRPVRCAGRAFVGVAWVDYQPGGDLSYRELLCAVLVRDGWRPRVTITHIWVDSVDSRDGGRALWGIPKDLATLRISDTGAAADGIASARLRPGVRWPARWPVRFRVVQDRDGRALTTPVRATARIGVGRRDRWSFAPDGPLAFLAGRTPTLSIRLDAFRMRFGEPPPTGRAAGPP